MMKNSLFMDFTVDKESHRMTVKREFAAQVPLVWSAWTQSEILDQWWAPKPWKTRTKTMDFKEGGLWLYAMVGPAGEEHWGRADYKTIVTEKNFKAEDSFCDAEGNINTELPGSKWEVGFNASGESTLVEVKVSFKSLEDLDQNLAMGVREGFTAALENLDEWLEKQ